MGGHGTTTRKLHYMYAYKNIWNGISNGKYKLSLNVSISCIDISGLLGDIFKILHMNTLAYCITPGTAVSFPFLPRHPLGHERHYAARPCDRRCHHSFHLIPL